MHEYYNRFEKKWPLNPNIRDFYARKQFDNTDPEFKAMIKEMLSGLQIAKETGSFP
jgi:truncated hemoglobin YjbI